MSMSMQERFLLLMERVSEPLYQSPRGSSNIFFNVPTDDVCEAKRKAASTVRRNMSTNTDKPPVLVNKPKNMPDLSHFGSICPRKGQFLYFVPSHRKLGEELKNILMAEKNMDEMFNLACACRDSEMINPQLFIYAMSSCILARKDMRQIRLPPFYEMMPDHFIGASAIQAAQEIGKMPMEDRMILELNSNTGRNSNPENKLWYFREDIGANSHHFHWHVVYRGDTKKPGEVGHRDRRGELFYYMHHGMIARYDAERLSNGLPRVKPVDLENPVISEGYFAKLYMTNAGLNWGNRQENTLLRDVDRVIGNDRLAVTLGELKMWRDRILEAIDSGYILKKAEKGQDSDTRLKIATLEGIDILGDMIENSTTLSPNLQFYGINGFHNMGHVLIAFSHDPRYKFKEEANVMGDTSTALRDPAFYRWHKYIDIIFEKHKATFQPYQDIGGDLPLKWNNVQVKSARVINSLDPALNNTLTTFWMMTDIDLARGIDFGRTDANMLGSVWGRFTHLQNDHFDYKIEVENKNPRPVLSTVRIFMAPRFDDNGERFYMTQQHTLFFEMDKFSYTLKTGMNSITRSSKESSITIPWENSFAQLEDKMRKAPADQYPPQEGICGCGWPQHLLLPKGSPEGMEFDVVVFLTNGDEDKPKKGQGMATGNDKEKCRQAMSYCGILDDSYPDSKPMGYPFDRAPYTVLDPMTDMQVPVARIENYVERIPNAVSFTVMIVHSPRKKIPRPLSEGSDAHVATESMDKMNIDGKCDGGKPNPNPREPTILGQTGSNPRSPPPRQNPVPPQYGWSLGNTHNPSKGGGGRGNAGRQVNFPNQGYRQGRDDGQGQEDDYEMVGNDYNY